MNFLKDSQMTAFMPRDKQNARSSFNDVRFRHAGWVVKPDMHVLRLMLWISGRAQSAGISSNTLVHLNSSQTAYASNRPRMPPVQGYSLSVGEPRGGRGEWDCIEDIHLWAVRDSVAPLGIDRLLYLIGSGKYREPLDGPASNHAYRYSLITDINWND
jgi:hypothetical protein